LSFNHCRPLSLISQTLRGVSSRRSPSSRKVLRAHWAVLRQRGVMPSASGARSSVRIV
jgi:hypothetical protein